MPDGVREQANRDDLKAKIDALPPTLVGEIEDFVEFVMAKYGSSTEQVGLGFPKPKQEHTFELEKEVEERTLKQDWAGALSHLEDEYTSVELKDKALEWWAEAAQE